MKYSNKLYFMLCEKFKIKTHILLNIYVRWLSLMTMFCFRLVGNPVGYLLG